MLQCFCSRYLEFTKRVTKITRSRHVDCWKLNRHGRRRRNWERYTVGGGGGERPVWKAVKKWQKATGPERERPERRASRQRMIHLGEEECSWRNWADVSLYTLTDTAYRCLLDPRNPLCTAALATQARRPLTAGSLAHSFAGQWHVATEPLSLSPGLVPTQPLFLTEKLPVQGLFKWSFNLPIDNLG